VKTVKSVWLTIHAVAVVKYIPAYAAICLTDWILIHALSHISLYTDVKSGPFALFIRQQYISIGS